jgi:hypothetical protein
MVHNVFRLTIEGMGPMAARQQGPLRPRLTHSGAVNGQRVLLMGIVLMLIAVAAVSGIVFALTTGQPTVALIIGLISGAFFSRVGC